MLVTVGVHNIADSRNDDLHISKTIELDSGEICTYRCYIGAVVYVEALNIPDSRE